MALMQCEFFSETLGISSSMTVILPQPTKAQIGMQGKAGAGKHPTLFLLHGYSDNHTIWLRRTSIERYAAELGLAVVMPAVNLSYYTDMKAGAAYWTFISEELPALVRSFFPLSDRREDNFVAGLSMGGYGAFKLALNKPEQYAAAASLSGALDAWATLNSMRPHTAQMTFGTEEEFRGSVNDLYHAAGQVAASEGPKPKLYQCCGTEDFLYGMNRDFLRHAQGLGLDLTYEEGPGSHQWGYWDRMIQHVLKWLPLGTK